MWIYPPEYPGLSHFNQHKKEEKLCALLDALYIPS